jgi:transmembrane sensor
MKDPDEHQDREEALRWLARLHSGEYGLEDRQAFQRWLAEDEAHWREYSKARRLWTRLEPLRAHRFPEIDEARAYRPPANPNAPWQRALAASFTVLAIGLMGGAAAWNAAISIAYRTALGEQRSFMLTDGSRVSLNTDSELRVVMQPRARLLFLQRGEALFEVTHDANRPFDVHAGGGTARAIGTRFGVQRCGRDVQVVVEEGIVAVGNGSQPPRALRQNQVIGIPPSGRLPAPSAVAAEDLLAWHQGKLVFTSQPLSEVLVELQRYHPIKVRLDDPALGMLKLSGVFNTAQWQPLLSSIEATLDLQADTTAAGELVLRRRKAPRP